MNLIDRFLAVTQVTRCRLQLVGVMAMLLSSKYEYMYFPEVIDFVYILDKFYSRADILFMEATMLNRLKVDLTFP